mgnify:CR=1 FL=1
MFRWLFLAMGLHAVSAQVVLLREMLVVLSGHEIAIGMMLCFWFVGVLLGAWGSAKRTAAEPHRAWSLSSLLLGSSTVLTLGILVAVRHLRVWVTVTPGAPLPALESILAMIACLVPQGAMVGAMFPLASSLAAVRGLRTARAIGEVYWCEAAGSLLGGMLLTFVLIPQLHGPEILAWCGMGATLAGACGMAFSHRESAVCLGVLGGCWAVFLLSGLDSKVQEWTVDARWSSLHPGMERLRTVDSPYQSVELGALEGQLTVFGNGRPIATFPDPVEAAPLVNILMNQEPRPRRLLLLGGGPASTIPMLLEHDLESLQMVELDPWVFEVARPFFPGEIQAALKDPRISLHHVDGRFLLERLSEGTLDAVVVQMPDPSTTLLNRFHTVEFFRACKRVLGPKGYLLHSITGSVNYLGPELEAFTGLIQRSLRDVFPQVRVMPGDRTLLLAAKEPGLLELDPVKLSRRAGSRGGSGEVPEGLFHMWIQPQQVELWERALESARGPLNRDEKPTSIVSFLALWEKLSGASFGARALGWLQGIPWWKVLVVMGSAVSLALMGRSGLVLRRSVLLAVGVTGLTAMAQEMVCLYLYQTVWGYLYSRLGLLVGAFMAGLAVGAWAGSILSGAGRDVPLGRLLGVQAGMAALCASIPVFWVPMLLGHRLPGPIHWSMEAGICLWMTCAGVATGGSFALACAAMAYGGASTRRIASLASVWDHLGAALGAILGGVVLVPALGLASTGLVLAGIQVAAASWLWIHFLARHRRGR